MNVIEGRNAVNAFLVGNRLGMLRFQLVQIKAQSHALNALLLKTEDNTTKTQINSRIDVLEKQQTKVENFILKQEDRFSLFGWLIASL